LDVVSYIVSVSNERNTSSNHVSLWQLARELGTYPDLIVGVCTLFSVPIDRGFRGRRMIRSEDVQLVTDLVGTWRARPKLQALIRPKSAPRTRAGWEKVTAQRPQHA
jgi:hypothetical protein